MATAPDMLRSNVEKGQHFMAAARALQARRPERVKDVRGRGLLLGIEVDAGAADVVARCRELGLLVNLAGEKTVRFAPAYLVTQEQLNDGLALFERAL
jgi:acetylornithine/N-succinyldiaminopimelate aminotransferase